MPIEYGGKTRFVCDYCGAEITDLTTAIRMGVQTAGIHSMMEYMNERTYVFCNPEHLNAWWNKSTGENFL
jgi:hypothetical protein